MDNKTLSQGDILRGQKHSYEKHSYENNVYDDNISLWL